ncbi:histidine kinase [Streptosporangium subroseum]|uniref:sensor histidine kinase n=1 Tax=Streptosporangium subroseum TaxID=106412 RepID=UPI003432292E
MYTIADVERLTLEISISHRMDVIAVLMGPERAAELEEMAARRPPGELISDTEVPLSLVAREIAERTLAVGGDADTLRILAANPFATVRQDLAGNPATPPEVLAELTRSTDSFTTLAAAANGSLPDEDLEVIGVMGGVAARLGALAHPRVPRWLIDQAATDPHTWVRAKAASNPNLSAPLLAALADDPDVDWEAVRAVKPGEVSPLREHTRLPATRAAAVRAFCHQLGADYSVEVWPHWWNAGDTWTIDWEFNEDGHPTKKEVAAALAAHHGARPYADQITLSTAVGRVIGWARTCQRPGEAVVLDTVIRADGCLTSADDVVGGVIGADQEWRRPAGHGQDFHTGTSALAAAGPGRVDPMVERRPLIVHRLRPGHWVAVDAVAAVLLAAAFCAAAWLASQYASIPLIALACSPLAVRRLWPFPVFLVVLAATAVAPFAGWQEAYLALAVALHAVALLEQRRPAVVALVAALTLTAVGQALASPSWALALSACGFAWLVLGLAWTVGLAVREQRAHTARAVVQSAQAAATAERLRMAREVHDVVAHSMSLISMRAGIANHVADTHPAEARQALTLIEDTSRSALADLRRLLGLLRDDPADLEVYGLAALPGLVAGAASAETRVDLHVEPGLTVADGLASVVYRVVQESLTNVIKHAGPARCRVAVSAHAQRELVVEVVDDGRGEAPGSGGGHGLAGMRERVTMYGGTCSAGPEPGGGFAVRARLPLGGGW